MVNRRKPISLDTTLRNPERIAEFLSVIANYEGEILTDDLILHIEADFIKYNLFRPTKSTLGTYARHKRTNKGEFFAEDQTEGASEKVDRFYSNWKNNKTDSHDEIVYLLKNTTTDHKVPGYTYGWPTRFQTQTHLINEYGFGFIFPNKKIKISEIGNLMITNYSNGKLIKDSELYDTNNDSVYSAFLMGFSKYQVNNPWRSNTVEVNLLPLFLNTVFYLNKEHNSSGLNKRELPFLICWGNNDYLGLAQYILRFRREYGYNATDETIYKYSMNLLESDPNNIVFKKATSYFLGTKQRDYKSTKVLQETPDDILRKFRLTQIVSLRGGGYFLDINHLEIDKAKFVMNSYSTNKELSSFSDEAYFAFMGEYVKDLDFTSPDSEVQKEAKEDAIQKALYEFSTSMSWGNIQIETDRAVTKKPSDDPVLSQIDKPTRMEFLISISLKKRFPKAEIFPNYIADDGGIPYHTASGGGADIVAEFDDEYMNIEPTISKSRAFQAEHEIPSISRHLIDDINSTKNSNRFALFIAGNVIKDAVTRIEFSRMVQNINIYAWNADDFLEYTMKATKFTDYKEIRPYAQKVEKIEF